MAIAGLLRGSHGGAIRRCSECTEHSTVAAHHPVIPNGQSEQLSRFELETPPPRVGAKVWEEKVMDVFDHQDEEVSVGGACETCPITLPENI